MAVIGGVPYTTTRSRRALTHKINLVPRSGTYERGDWGRPMPAWWSFGTRPDHSPLHSPRVFPGAGQHAGGAAGYPEKGGELCEEGAHLKEVLLGFPGAF